MSVQEQTLLPLAQWHGNDAAVARGDFTKDAINIPNALTFARIVLIPVVLYYLAQDTLVTSVYALAFYTVSSVTDFLDGWLARKMGLESVLGKFLDPLADKLLVMSTLVYLASMGRLGVWGVGAVIVIIARELSITALRTIALSEGVVMGASRSGKDKTAVQMVAIVMLMLHESITINFGWAAHRVNLNAVGLGLLGVAALLSVTSAGEYIALLIQTIEAKSEREPGT